MCSAGKGAWWVRGHHLLAIRGSWVPLAAVTSLQPSIYARGCCGGDVWELGEGGISTRWLRGEILEVGRSGGAMAE